MLAEPPPPPPRRKLHLVRWIVVVFIAVSSWGGWRAYAFRSALKQANALGWTVRYTDPVETIRTDWRAAFEKATWLDGVTEVIVPTSESLEPHLAILYRLNP